MHLYNLLRKEIKQPLRLFLGIVILSGIFSTLLVEVINSAAENVANKSTTQVYFLIYILCVGLVFIAKKYVFDQSFIIIENVVGRIRKRIANKIRYAELSTFEKVGLSPFYARLTQDVLRVSDTAWYLISSFQSSVIIFFMLIYIAHLSMWAFFMVFLGVCFSVYNYVINNEIMKVNFRNITIKETVFFEKFSHILQGFKEMKINKKKSDAVFKKYTEVTDDRTILRIIIKKHFNISFITSQVFIYMMIGVILFIIPHYHESHAATIIKITAAILFIMGPIEGLSSAIPILAIAENAAFNIINLEKELDEELATKNRYLLKDVDTQPILFKESIQLKGLIYEYEHNDPAHAFRIGPMNLTIKKGEVIFITGGNGSGKSTFLKLFTGLYSPKYGSIYIDKDEKNGKNGTLITSSNYLQYSELFTTIFTDFHVFDKLYGLDNLEEDKVNQLLQKLELPQEKTAFRNGGFTNVKLSSGQKKRLALATCILEDKEIYIFDEVAADLDPEFRDTYYFETLAELKALNKTILVVSHDKSYWHVADRVLKLVNGQFYEEGQITEVKQESVQEY